MRQRQHQRLLAGTALNPIRRGAGSGGSGVAGAAIQVLPGCCTLLLHSCPPAQVEVFDEVWPLIRSCADGYNVCILAYGQTASGKTHTMMGPGQDPGAARAGGSPSGGVAGACPVSVGSLAVPSVRPWRIAASKGEHTMRLHVCLPAPPCRPVGARPQIAV